MKRLKPEWRPNKPAEQEAARVLPKYARAYLRAGAKAAKHETEAGKLHAFRLVTKDFRYLLESFQPLYRANLKSYFDTLRTIQKLLGELNDYAVTAEMMKKEKGPAREALLVYLDKEQKRKLKRFVKFWQSHFGTAEQQALWIKGLG